MITLATWFTLGRIILVPVIVVALINGQWGWGCGTFIVASLTDMLDGAIARWYKEHTALGACLDAVADKILLISCFSTLAWMHSALIPRWFVYLIIVKELCLLSGALIVGFEKGWHAIKPTLFGKAITCAQIFFITWFFLCHFFNWHPMKTWYGVLYGLACGIIIVLIHYMLVAFRMCDWSKQSEKQNDVQSTL